MNLTARFRLCALSLPSSRLVLSRLRMSTQTPPTNNQNTEFKKRSVVSNFIFNLDTPDGGPRVALFRRSDKVSTYKHHLAPISGSIERTDPSPLAASWREITEETALTPASLILWRQGKSYTFSDASIRREWTVHPFAFRLRAGAEDASKIQIDWEHEGWDWYDPSAVQDSEAFGGVPRLAESLRRVWFERDLGNTAGKVLSDGLDMLANDFTSGARQMAGDALGILRDVVAALGESDEDPGRWWVNVRVAAWHICKNGRESMGAAIMSALISALAEIEKTIAPANPSQELTAKERLNSTLNILDKRIASRQESVQRVSDSLKRYLTKTFSSKVNGTRESRLSILTLSESSTIAHALRCLALSSNFTLDLRILESRPLFEGISLAASLAKDFPRRHQITIYTDASAVLASQSVDLVVVGADRIASTGAVSNKTGTLPAVLAARHVTSSPDHRQRAKIAVLTESEKIARAAANRVEDHVVENGDPVQVTAAWSEAERSRIKAAASTISTLQSSTLGTAPAGVAVKVTNISFEWCPPELIDVYITESGESTVQDIAAYSEWLGKEEARLFGDL